MRVFCPECGEQDNLSPQRFRCFRGGAWESEELTSFDPGLIDPADNSLWRYRKLFGLDFEEPTVRLGAGGTPLLTAILDGR